MTVGVKEAASLATVYRMQSYPWLFLELTSILKKKEVMDEAEQGPYHVGFKRMVPRS